MARPPRLQSVSGYYHVILRGNNKQILFESRKDARVFLFLLKKYKAITPLNLLAYCLMDNHVHLLIHDDKQNLTGYMRRVEISYARYFQETHTHIGHLFQDRFRSIEISDERQLLAAYRYILLNPEKAGLAGATEYRWNSFHDYDKTDGISSPGIIKDLIGSKDSLRSFLYSDYGTEYFAVSGKRINDADAITILKTLSGLTDVFELNGLNPQTRNRILREALKRGISIRQLSRITGVGKGVIQKL